jgi:hypothetical protein
VSDDPDAYDHVGVTQHVHPIEFHADAWLTNAEMVAVQIAEHAAAAGLVLTGGFEGETSDSDVDMPQDWSHAEMAAAASAPTQPPSPSFQPAESPPPSSPPSPTTEGESRQGEPGPSEMSGSPPGSPPPVVPISDGIRLFFRTPEGGKFRMYADEEGVYQRAAG